MDNMRTFVGGWRLNNIQKYSKIFQTNCGDHMKNHELSKELIDKQEELFKICGWYSHFIYDDTCPFGVDNHTHGFGYLFHPDIQICIKFPPDFNFNIFKEVYSRIKNGEKFEVGKIYSGFLENNFQVTFIQIDEDVIRMILPDEKNCLNPQKMNPAYAIQFQKEFIGKNQNYWNKIAIKFNQHES